MTVSWDRETRTVARRPWWKTKASLWRDLEAEKARHDRYVAGQKELNDRLLADLGDYTRKITERDHGIASIEMQKRELGRDRDKWASTAEDLRCTLVHRDGTLDNQRERLVLYVRANDALADELREMTAERDALAAVSDQMRDSVGVLVKANDDLDGLFCAVAAERDTLREDLRHRTHQVDQLRTHATRLTDELREMTAERDALAAMERPLYWQCQSLNECTRRAHDATAWRRTQEETLHPAHTPSSLVAAEPDAAAEVEEEVA